MATNGPAAQHLQHGWDNCSYGAFMRITARAVCALLLLTCPAIQAEGDARTKVQNDLLLIELMLVKEGAVAAQLHAEMQKEAANALDKSHKIAAVRVKTSGYNIYPVYEKERIVRHRATYQISLETTDFNVGLSLAAAMQPFQISNLSFSVSPERRKTTEKTLIEEAIADLRDNFTIAANSLSLQTITITNLTIGPRQYNPIPPQMMKASMAMEGAPPVAAEAGESEVSITVSGSARVK